MTPETPTHSPTYNSLNGFRLDSNRVNELILCCDHFVEVFAQVQVECGLNPRVTQNALHL